MLDIRNKLEIQDLIREIEENNIKYKINISKTLKEGKISFLDIEVIIDD